ncbi:hypothetical protein TRIP_B250404 [uncultured Desulfatiglans sp.]|nr:hypothetical protein TRIP_B250404 [uncultured Desulfatiglans sp.]
MFWLVHTISQMHIILITIITTTIAIITITAIVGIIHDTDIQSTVVGSRSLAIIIHDMSDINLITTNIIIKNIMNHTDMNIKITTKIIEKNIKTIQVIIIEIKNGKIMKKNTATLIKI